MTAARLRLLLPLLAALAAVHVAPAQDLMALDGNDSNLWAVVGSSSGYRILHKPQGLAWNAIAEGTGNIVAGAAVGSQFQVLFSPVDGLIYDTNGIVMQAANPRLDLWPKSAAPVALASAHDWKGPSGRTSSVIAVVARPAENSAPADGPESLELRPRSVALGLFVSDTQQWSHVADAGTVSILQSSRLFIAVRGRFVYVLVSRDSEGHNRLFRVTTTEPPAPPPATPPAAEPDAGAAAEPPREGRTSETPAGGAAPAEAAQAVYDVSELPLADPLKRSPAIGCVTIQGRLVIPLLVASGSDSTTQPAPAPAADDAPPADGAPPPDAAAAPAAPAPAAPGAAASGQLHLALVDNVGKHEMVPLLQNDQPLVLPSNARADRLETRVALLWQQDGLWSYATASINGQFSSEGTPEAFVPKPKPVNILEILQYVMIGLAILVLLTMVVLRPRGQQVRPFSLPTAIIPASPILRLAAFLIDFLPLFLIGALIFPFQVETQADMARALEGGEPTFLFAVMTGLGLLVMIGGFMEYRFGFTPGKRLLKMRVIGTEGRTATLRGCILRNLLKPIELLVPPTLPLLLVMPLLNRYRQRLGDIVANTTVVFARSLEAEQKAEEPHALAEGAEPMKDETADRQEHEPEQEHEHDQDKATTSGDEDNSRP